MNYSARQQGLSLIELMVSITIGLLVVAGLVGLVASTSASRGELEKLNLQIENGRYAFETLADDVRHAGYFGFYQAVRESPPPATPDACATDVTAMKNSLNTPVQGISNYGAANTSAVRAAIFSCLPATAIVSGTDVLAIRRVSTTAVALSNAGVPTPSITANAPYLQSGMVPDTSSPGLYTTTYVIAAPSVSSVDLTTFTAKIKDTGTGTSASNPATFNTPAPLRQFLVHIYFISPCSDAVLDCSSGDGIPSLKRLTLGAGPAFPTVPEVIAAGIEDFQVDYGLNTGSTQVTSSGSTTYYDGSANTFVECNPSSSTTYDNTSCFQDVVALRIHLLARNNDPSPGYTDNRTYDMGVKGTTAAKNDSYKRHVYTGLVRLNSTAMGRECVPTYTSPC